LVRAIVWGVLCELEKTTVKSLTGIISPYRSAISSCTVLHTMRYVRSDHFTRTMIYSRFGIAGPSHLTYGPKRRLHIYNNCLVIYTKHVKLDLYLYSALDKKNLGPIRASSMKTMPAGPEWFFKVVLG